MPTLREITHSCVSPTEIKMIGVKALTDTLGEVNAEKFMSDYA
jgi:hypothetical protein